MFRRLTAAAGVLLAATAIAAPAANAEIPAIDDAPAATLLLPYFEVDLDKPAPAQTGAGSNDNILWGDYQYIPATGQAPAQGGTAPSPQDDVLVDEADGQPVEQDGDNRGPGGGGHGHHGGGHGDERD